MFLKIGLGAIILSALILVVVGWTAGILEELPKGLQIMYYIACGLSWVAILCALISLIRGEK